jgi:hypothetical protein
VSLLLGNPFLDLYTQSIIPREKAVWVHDPETEDRWLVPLISKTEPEKSGPRAKALVKVAADVCIAHFTE